MRSTRQKFAAYSAAFILFGLLMGLASSARAGTNYVLENGLVRVAFDQIRGQFEVRTSGNAEMVLAGAPRVQVDGQSISVGEARKIEVKEEVFETPLGSGEKLLVDYRFSGSFPGFRYEVELYKGKPWVSATAFIPKGNFRLGDLTLMEGKLRVPEAFNTRVYVNSGSAGGDSGVWELGMRRWQSSVLSVIYAPTVKTAVELGFYSFYRASTNVTVQYWGSSEVAVRADAHYNGYRPEGEELKTESLLMDFGADPLNMLEEWTDAAVKTVHPSFLHDTRTGMLNSWYMYGDEDTEDDNLKQARMLRNSPLFKYGVTISDTGEWQQQRHEYGDEADALGFGEDQEDRRLFPHTSKWLSDQLHRLGVETDFGANYAYAAPESTIARRNVPWIVREDRSRLGFGFPIDFTNPDAKKWLSGLAQRAVDYKAIEWWTDFDGGPTRGKLYDPTKIMGFEDIREGLSVTRSVLGANVMIHKFCCGPYFTYLGLADRVRVGRDMVGLGDMAGLKDIARQLAANYMLHQRFWINDPDPVYVGGRDYVHNYGTGPVPSDRAIRDEVRMRLLLQMTSGGFVTIGENQEDLDAERIRLLTLVLPTYGQAARPLDLFTHTTPEEYDLSVKASWGNWNILMLQNWNDWDKKYDIQFSGLGLDASRSYWIFSFWDQTFLGEFRQGASLTVQARKGEAFSIREARRTPWVLGTDLHLTQGGVELEDVRYDESSARLSGVARRHAGAQGHIVAFVPPGYKVLSATGAYSLDPQPSGAAVAHLELQFTDETAPWSLTFEKAE